MGKRKFIIIGLCLLLVGGLAFGWYSYFNKIQNSDLMTWCKSISLSTLEKAVVHEGSGAEETQYDLTDEEKVQLVKILNSLNSEDIQLNGDGKLKADRYLYVEGNRKFYLLEYSSERPQKLYVQQGSTHAVENNKFGPLKNYWVQNDKLISFLTNRSPDK